jgi:hypothetical protein
MGYLIEINITNTAANKKTKIATRQNRAYMG